MPRKLLNKHTVPTLILERLHTWGRCIYTQRLSQRLTIRALCERAGLSEATLRRLEERCVLSALDERNQAKKRPADPARRGM